MYKPTLEERIDRDDWKFEQTQKCFCCGRKATYGMHLDIHEISRRKFKGYFHRCNYLLLCNGFTDHAPCHNQFDIGGRDNKVLQLAVKQLIDPEDYSLTEWLSRFDPAESRSPTDEPYITQREVDVEAEKWRRRSRG